MTISTVNCTPIKPQTSFGRNENGQGSVYFYEYSSEPDRFNDKSIKTSDIKNPAEIGASVVLAGASALLAAKGITNKITSFDFAKGAGTAIENLLKKGAGKIQKKAKELSETVSNKTISVDNLKKNAGKLLQKGEEKVRGLYKSVAYSGISKETTNPERANKALANVIGAGAAATTIAGVCSRDTDKNGVADIMQKSQNAYIGNKNMYENANDTIDKISEFAKILT